MKKGTILLFVTSIILILLSNNVLANTCNEDRREIWVFGECMTCSQSLKHVSRVLEEALVASNKGCVSDNDCQASYESTNCFGDCPKGILKTKVKFWNETIKKLNTDGCDNHSKHCGYFTPMCTNIISHCNKKTSTCEMKSDQNYLPFAEPIVEDEEEVKVIQNTESVPSIVDHIATKPTTTGKISTQRTMKPIGNGVSGVGGVGTHNKISNSHDITKNESKTDVPLPKLPTLL